MAEVIRDVERGETLDQQFYFLSVADRASSSLRAPRRTAPITVSRAGCQASNRPGGHIHVAYLCGGFGVIT